MWGMDGFDMGGMMGGWGGDAWGFDGFDGFKGGKGKGFGKDKGKGKGGKGSKAQMKLSKGEKVYSGKLISYNAEKTSGFVFSDQVYNEHGQDRVYAFHNVLEETKVGVGDEISFFLHWNAKGQVAVSSPVMRLASSIESNLVMKGYFKQVNKDDKTFGFIDCPDVKNYFGKDVYVAGNLCEGLTTGGLVAFNAYLNKDGMPNAQAVCACDESYEPMPGDLSVSAEAAGYEKGSKGKGKGFGKDGGFGKGFGKHGGGKGKGKDFGKMAAMSAMGVGGGPY